MSVLPTILKRIILLLILVLAMTGILLTCIIWGLKPATPEIANRKSEAWVRLVENGGFYKVHHSWLRFNSYGLWEEYLEGNPFDRGVAESKLTSELQITQEEAFVEQLQNLVPDKKYLGLLGYFARIFNRNLNDNIKQEYREEIYGESLFAPHQFDFVADPYERLLNYHSAHDLGHTFQNLALVGCTSFAVWGSKTKDSLLLVGRNFDFYMGDKFARNKIILFCKPTTGHKFAMVTWASFIGCVSGMNDAGLTITINSAETDLPTGSATPISLLALEILQYSTTIREALEIARKRKIFVSESLLIASAKDHKAAIIEKSPKKIALYDPGNEMLLSTNHFLSDTFTGMPVNIYNKLATSSGYRYEHLKELLDKKSDIDYKYCAQILRDQRGKGGKDIGMGNEKAINQLIAHHSVIFQPERRKFWVSTSAFMLGEYVCYNLDSFFNQAENMDISRERIDLQFTIPADTFLKTQQWQAFLKYRKEEAGLLKVLSEKRNGSRPNTTWEALIQLNREYWYPYFLLGKYYQQMDMPARALAFYRQALTKEINDSADIYEIKSQIKKLAERMEPRAVSK